MNEVKGLAFFDLDGTLLNEHSDITIEISQALVELQENGIVPVIATGRTNLEIKEICNRTGIESLITMNGQHVQFEGETVYSSVIPTEVCTRMKALALSLDQEVGFYTPEEITVTAHTPMVKSHYDFIHAKMPAVKPEQYQDSDVNMLLILGQEHDQLYKDHFPELRFYRNTPYSIDVVSQDGSKGKGVRELVAALGLEGLPTYAFGDGLNDIDLLKACDYRIAMGNAKPELKEIATYITTNNTDGGILRGLRQYGLIS